MEVKTFPAGLSETFTEMLIVIALVISVSALVQYHWRRRRLYRMAAKIPGPPTYPIIGNAHLFIGSPKKFLPTLAGIVKRYSLPAKLWLGNRVFFGLSDPRHLEILMNHPNTMNRVVDVKFLKPICGDGLFAAKGMMWKKNRKLIAPTFNPKTNNNLLVLFAEHVAILEGILEENVNSNVNVVQKIGNCITDLVVENSMGVKVNAQLGDAKFLQWIQTLLRIAYMRVSKVWYQNDFIFYKLPIGREFQQILQKFSGFIDEIIVRKRAIYHERKRLASECPEAEIEEDSTNLKSFLDLLMELNEDDHSYSNKELRDEVATFIIGGADTTTTALGFAIMCLGMFPEHQQKVYEEVIDVLGPDKAIQLADLPNLKYTERCIYESMRLFPIGSTITREVEGDVDLGDYVLPGGSSVLFFLSHTHRLEKHWPNPLKFDPDRFLPEEVANRHPYAFQGFSAGNRNCIGKRHAIMMTKSMVAHLVRRFEFSSGYESVEDVTMVQEFLSKPMDGYQITYKLRN